MPVERLERIAILEFRSDGERQPCGYEGYLADVFYILLAVVLKEPELRARMLRPLA